MDPTIYRSLLAIDPNTNLPISTNYILSTDGFGDLSWQNVLYNISSQSDIVGYLPSTIGILNTYMSNVSTGVLPGSLSTFNLVSTVEGLGTFGYISSLTFKSTIIGLGTLGYLSSQFLGSTIDGLGTCGYVSTMSLISSIHGLGTFGYVSSPSLLSTIDGLGTYRYISSLSLNSTITGLGRYGYVSSLSLISTINGLGSMNYVSSASLFSSMQYMVTSLVSSSTDLYNNKQNIYLNNVGSLVIGGYNINVTISTISSFYLYNTFYNSSIKYKGINNAQVAYNPIGTYDFYISTLDTQLDIFSTSINSRTHISLEVYPNIIFPRINTNSNAQIYHVSSFLTYNGSTINILNQTKFLAMNNASSNLFQQPLRLNIPGYNIVNYKSPYLLTHRFVNVFASNTNVGFASSNVNLFFDSTSSYYLSIQNIAP